LKKARSIRIGPFSFICLRWQGGAYPSDRCGWSGCTASSLPGGETRRNSGPSLAWSSRMSKIEKFNVDRLVFAHTFDKLMTRK